MKNLRGITPLNATAAVLPGYDLRFDGSGGNNGGARLALEPSAAFVVPSQDADAQVHGVLYTLTADDFARVGWTEGVPFAYRWERCRVYPYVGKAGENVGSDLLLRASQNSTDSSPTTCNAVTLVSPKKFIERDVPPSSSYLNIIQRGARYWDLDESYQTKLASIPAAKNLLIPGGLSGPLLQLAETIAGFQGKKS